MPRAGPDFKSRSGATYALLALAAVLILCPFALRPVLGTTGALGAVAYALLGAPRVVGIGLVVALLRPDAPRFTAVVLAATVAVAAYTVLGASPSYLEVLGGTRVVAVDVVGAVAGASHGGGSYVSGTITASDGTVYPVPGLSVAVLPAVGPHRLLVTVHGGWVLAVDPDPPR